MRVNPRASAWAAICVSNLTIVSGRANLAVAELGTGQRREGQGVLRRALVQALFQHG